MCCWGSVYVIPDSFHTQDNTPSREAAGATPTIVLPVFPEIGEGMDETMLRVFGPSGSDDD